METTGIRGIIWGYIGKMEKNMETTGIIGLVWGYIGIIGKIFG